MGGPFWLLAAGWERGVVAALLAAPALVYAIWLFAHGAGRFLQNTVDDAAVAWLEALSSTSPLVAAVAWVWSRYDSTFAGFPEPLATLTVVHFSITFGVLPAAMAAWTREGGGRGGRAALWIYVGSAPLTALAFALRGEWMRPGLVEALLAGVFAAGFILWWGVTGRVEARVRRLGAPLVAGFVLGAGFSVAGHFGWPWLDIPQMFVIHGALNLCGSLALVGAAPVRAGRPSAPRPEGRYAVDAGAVETAWFRDDHRVELGPWSEAGFERVKALLLGYQFYPATVMERQTQFELEGRPARVGDRIGLGLRLPNLPGLRPVHLPAVVEIHELFSDATTARLGYQTTTFHYGRGQWLAEVRREGEWLVLSVRAHVRPSRWWVWLGLPVYRRFQLAAFHAGCARLKSVLG